MAVASNPLRRTKWGRTGAFGNYDDVRAFFDLWAKHPDANVPGSVSYEADLADCYVGARILAQLLLAKLNGFERRILDVGCGTGLVGVPLMRAGHALYGIDLSHQMLGLAREKGYVDVRAADIVVGAPPWPFEFDALVSAGVAGEWVPPITLLENTIGHLAGSSVIALSLETAHSDLTQIRRFLAQHGFDVEHVSTGLGLDHPVYEQEHYFYLIACRKDQ